MHSSGGLAFKSNNFIYVIQYLMLLIIHIQTLLKLELNLPYHDILFDCNATSFSHAFSGKHSFQCMNNSKKGEARLFLGALLFSRVLQLRHLVFWLALCPPSLSISSASALGSLSALIPSLSAAFHSLPPSLKTQSSQLPQAIEGQSEAFKGTLTAAIILLSHRKVCIFLQTKSGRVCVHTVCPSPPQLFMCD